MSSQEVALELWMEHFRNLPLGNNCRAMIENKGIVISPQRRVNMTFSDPEKEYMQTYWRQQGVLDDSNQMRMTNTFYKARAVLIQGQLYHIGSKVVVEEDNPDGLGSKEELQSWRGIISLFIIHEFESHVGIFFKAEYYDQVFTSTNSSEHMLHHVSHMRMIRPNPRKYSGNDIRPVNQIQGKFMTFPACGTWASQNILVAYDLSDQLPRKHLLQIGQPGCPPPWLEVHDVVLVKMAHETTNDSIHVAVVIKVFFEANKEVELQLLTGIPPQPFYRYKLGRKIIREPWDNVMCILESFEVSKRNNVSRPIEWTTIKPVVL